MAEMLAGKRILVVEDDYFIASDIRRMLQGQGAVVVGPVGDLQAALSLAEEPIDAAVLDVNLEEATSYPVADRLGTRDIPYMFLTGYDGWSLPPDYRGAARLAKPFGANAVVAMLEVLMAG